MGEKTVSKVELYYKTDKEYKFYIECPLDFPRKLCVGAMVDSKLNLYTNIEFEAFEQTLDPAFFISRVRNELGSWSVGVPH